MESVNPSPRTTWERGRNKSAGGMRYERNMPVDSDWLPGKRMRASA